MVVLEVPNDGMMPGLHHSVPRPFTDIGVVGVGHVFVGVPIANPEFIFGCAFRPLDSSIALDPALFSRLVVKDA